MISQYNLAPDKLYGVKNMTCLVTKRLTMRGFIVSDPDFGPKYAKEHYEKVGQWIADGTFKVQMSMTDGMDNAVDGFLGMLKGENFGKAVLKVAGLDEKVCAALLVLNTHANAHSEAAQKARI